MRLYEFVDELESIKVKLIGLLKQYQGRIGDTGASKPASLTAILNLLASEGINLSPEEFRKMSLDSPINNVISNIQGDNVIFKGQTNSPEPLDQEESEKIIDKMSKRATNKTGL